MRSRDKETAERFDRDGLFDLGPTRGSGVLELLGIEFQEEKARTFRLFLLAGISLIFGLLVLVGLSAAVVIAFWETHRMAAILSLCLIYAVLMALCIGRAIRLAKECATPFQATLEEIARDRERLLP